MTWTVIAEDVGALFLLAGVVFTLAAAIGLVRLPDMFSRMHAASKPQLVGFLLICVGLALSMHSWRWVGISLVLLAIQTVTAPVGSHLLGRAGYRTGIDTGPDLVTDELAQDLHRTPGGLGEPR